MTIGYSTHWPKTMGPEYAGKPNHFPNKIMKYCWQNIPYQTNDYVLNQTEKDKLLFDKIQPFGSISVFEQEKLIPKLHTFRHDLNDRWKVGMKIHPVIHNRTKNRFQFAPELVVKSIQKIRIKVIDEIQKHYSYTIKTKLSGETYLKHFEVYIDDRFLTKMEVRELATNDGFESVEQFFAWFNKDFTGKIIHWTNLKY